MPAVILSETSRRHCVSNSVPSRNKSSDIQLPGKYMYTLTYLVSLARGMFLFSFKSENRNYLIYFFSCYIVYNALRNSQLRK